MALREGKTKVLEAGPRPGTVLMHTKNELTGGDAAKKAVIAGIAAHKTAQATHVFTLLQRHGIPTAFLERAGETALLCAECEMLPLELVMRRYAWGSFLKREPSFAPQEGQPHRFARVHCEFFHKWAVVLPPLVEHPQQMEETEARAQFLRDGVWAEGVYTDPYVHITGEVWTLHSAKLPIDPTHALLEIPPTCSSTERTQILERLMRPCFEVLENAWQKIQTAFGPVALADMKIEVGRRKSDGELVIADVIDNDSWRIWPGADPQKQLDKQNFRDGHPLSTVADNYALVAELTRQFL